MRFYKKAWSIIRVFLKSYVFFFLLFYFAIDVWYGICQQETRAHYLRKGFWWNGWFIPKRNTTTPPTNLLTGIPTQVSGLHTPTMSLSYSANQSSDSTNSNSEATDSVKNIQKKNTLPIAIRR